MPAPIHMSAVGMNVEGKEVCFLDFDFNVLILSIYLVCELRRCVSVLILF